MPRQSEPHSKGHDREPEDAGALSRRRFLTSAGVSAAGAALLDKVHAPIGLDIGAETPAEIAVSILAEIVQFRARRRPAAPTCHSDVTEGVNQKLVASETVTRQRE